MTYNFMRTLLLLMSVGILTHESMLYGGASRKRKSRGGVRKKSGSRGKSRGKGGGGGGGTSAVAAPITTPSAPVPPSQPILPRPVMPTPETEISFEEATNIPDAEVDTPVIPAVPPLDSSKRPEENLDQSELAPLPPPLEKPSAQIDQYINDLKRKSELELMTLLADQIDRLDAASTEAHAVIYVISGDRKVNRVKAQFGCIRRIDAASCKALGCDNRLLCLAATVSTLRNALIPIYRELPRTVLILSVLIDKINKEDDTIRLYKKSLAPIFAVVKETLQVLRIAGAILRALGRYQKKVLPSKPTPAPTPAPTPPAANPPQSDFEKSKEAPLPPLIAPTPPPVPPRAPTPKPSQSDFEKSKDVPVPPPITPPTPAPVAPAPVVPPPVPPRATPPPVPPRSTPPPLPPRATPPPVPPRASINALKSPSAQSNIREAMARRREALHEDDDEE